MSRIAAKYTNDGGLICLTIQQEGQQAAISVRDTGVGIAPKLLPGLPGMSGFEVAKKVHDELELRKVKLGAMTGYGQQTDIQRSQKAGFDHHLVKPADFSEFEHMLATVGSGAR